MKSMLMLAISLCLYAGQGMAADPQPAAPEAMASRTIDPASIDLDAVRRVIADPAGLAAPGCTASAFHDGRQLFAVASGAADLASGKPLDQRTLFYAASVSKQFTALAVAQLAVAGKIDLDGDVRHYLPELPQYEATITPRMLLNHTSGIADWLGVAALLGVSDWGSLEKRQALAMIYAQPATAFKPGTRFSYSNGGYLLLAELVERVSGQASPDYVAKKILRPMGMRDGGFLAGTRRQGAGIAHGYVPEGDGYVLRDTYPAIGGSGGLMISTDDFARYEYDIAVGHKVWTDAVRAIMLQPGVLADGKPADRLPGLAYAGGLLVGVRDGQAVIEHAGGAEAFRTQFLRLPEQHVTVVVLCNRGDWNPNVRADAIANLVTGTSLWKDGAPMPETAGRFVSAEQDTRYQLVAAGDQLRVTITSPFTSADGEQVLLKRGAKGAFDTEPAARRPLRIEFEPGGAAIKASIAGTNTMRLLREQD